MTEKNNGGTREAPDRFGDCPECKTNDGYLNLGKDHWFYCEEHKTRWFVGANLFSAWRHETEEDWESNAKKLSSYREVEPYIHPSLAASPDERGHRSARGSLGEGAFAIKYNTVAVNDPCEVCGKRTDPIIGPELFERDSWALVCHECGNVYAPNLMACLRLYHAARGVISDEVPF